MFECVFVSDGLLRNAETRLRWGAWRRDWVGARRAPRDPQMRKGHPGSQAAFEGLINRSIDRLGTPLLGGTCEDHGIEPLEGETGQAIRIEMRTGRSPARRGGRRGVPFARAARAARACQAEAWKLVRGELFGGRRQHDGDLDWTWHSHDDSWSSVESLSGQAFKHIFYASRARRLDHTL